MMRCIIIDDEPLARELLESYVNRIAELELLRSCANALQALSQLQDSSVDLLFLDIEMPQVTGIELLRSLKIRPAVILTTAYRGYAFEAYDLDVVDYMLKPVTFERFMRGIGKIKQLKQYASNDKVASPESASFDDAYLYLKENREMVKVFLKDILYIESMRDYVRIKTDQRQVVTYQKISYLEQKLPQNKFVRIHRSYIIAIDKVSSFSPTNVSIKQVDIPIGRNYKNVVLKQLSGQSFLV